MRFSPLDQGFSLVELSIVLVILGLLVGGILSGKSLIRASELRSITTQYNNYYTATRAFRDKYFALPGDMTNAQSFWGVLNAAPATCVVTPSTDTRTCNGDGNGWVENVFATKYEYSWFWQHLSNAGLIEGSYPGTGFTCAMTPAGKLPDSHWSVEYYGQIGTGYSTTFEGEYGHVLGIGGGGCAGPKRGFLTPEEAWNIDTKMDDGKPGVGKVVIYAFNGVEFCTTAASGADTLADAQAAAYLLSSSNKECSLLFRNQF